MKLADKILSDEGYVVVMATDEDGNSVPKGHICPDCEIKEDCIEDSIALEVGETYHRNDANVYVGFKEDGSAKAMCLLCGYWKTKDKDGYINAY